MFKQVDKWVQRPVLLPYHTTILENINAFPSNGNADLQKSKDRLNCVEIFRKS